MELTHHHVVAKYSEVYSRIVGAENSDFWPAKWVAARSVLRNDADYELGKTRLTLLLTDKEIAEADGNYEEAVKALAQKIWSKNIVTTAFLFEIDGKLRRFWKRYRDLPKGADTQPLISSTLESMEETLQKIPHPTP